MPAFVFAVDGGAGAGWAPGIRSRRTLGPTVGTHQGSTTMAAVGQDSFVGVLCRQQTRYVRVSRFQQVAHSHIPFPRECLQRVEAASVK